MYLTCSSKLAFNYLTCRWNIMFKCYFFKVVMYSVLFYFQSKSWIFIWLLSVFVMFLFDLSSIFFGSLNWSHPLTVSVVHGLFGWGKKFDQIHFPVVVFGLNVEQTTFLAAFISLKWTNKFVLSFLTCFNILFGLMVCTHLKNCPICRSPTSPLGITAQHYKAQNYCSIVTNAQAGHVEANSLTTQQTRGLFFS